MDKKRLNIFFLIFTLSGFSGLIYESIWTHYLKLFLGHAAYAQTLVLAIFMGGMALGSWICSRYSLRWKNLLIGYALTEGAIGLFALAFHNVFDQTVRFSYAGVIPHLDSAAAAYIYKWTLSALLILPQSVLLGMTFPLMSAGIIRAVPQAPGRTISLLYFTNSIGAAIGVLVSGFILIRLVGLPWTIRLAGLINIALALSVWLLMRGRALEGPAAWFEKERPVMQRDSWYFLFLAASLVTGTASFIYEIGWIRMLSLVLGSSTHAFELMLSAFIFGLAFGSLWIQRRIDRIEIPGRSLAFVQVVMGLLALSTLPLYGQTFYLMRWLVTTLGKTDAGYTLFNLSSNAMALAIMLPTTFCAGMTLPLITTILMKKRYGERSIGAVYAANTVGAIVGVFFAIHVGMPVLGLKGLITFGAGLDIALGLMLFWGAAHYTVKRLPLGATVLCISAVAATLLLVDLDPYRMASGVYRSGKLLLPQGTELLYYKDGKTATVSCYRSLYDGVTVINTNGKPDAAINMITGERAAMDEPTMILLGVLPMAMNARAETAAAIGFGSGLTTHTLLSNPYLKQVDTVEIERNMVEAANNFRPRVELAYTDPRSAIYIDDAKTFFSVRNRKYDIIVSEPSNPWVSGVAGLFSDEFYRLVGRHLTKDGLFVQWVQLYEIDTDLVVSILKSISSNFADFVVYGTNDADMVIVARNNGTIGGLDPGVLSIPRIAEALARIQINTAQDFEIRKMGDKKFLGKLIESYPIRGNSDYYPVLDQNAARSRFLRSDALALHEASHTVLPVGELLSGDGPQRLTTDVTPSPFFAKSQLAYEAMVLREYYMRGTFDLKPGDTPPDVKQEARNLERIFFDCRLPLPQRERMTSLYNTGVRMTTHLAPRELDAVWKKLESGPCDRSLSPMERDLIGLFKAVGRRDAGAMLGSAKNILDSGQPVPPEIVKYCVASGMLGSLMHGDRETALGLWYAYRRVMFGEGPPDLLFRLLVADSAGPG